MIDRLRWIPLIFLCLALPAAEALAQAINPQDDAFGFSNPSEMPAWTVPVLRLVSATHVEPTTGIVISSDGLVLVPEDFASVGDEIIVLDGGTDIIRNGRPARLEQRLPGTGLKALRVKGLDRRGAPLPERLSPDGSVRLAAYPPAERIAEGDPPVRIETSIVIAGETGQPVLARQESLPNVTGALLDSCGNLVGVSIAADVQTMEPSPATRYQWLAALRAILDGLGVTPAPSLCPTGETSETPEPETPPAAPPEAEPATTPEEEAQPEPAEAEAPPEEETPEDIEPEPAEPEPQWDILPPIETGDASADTHSPDDGDPGRSGWLWLLGAAALFALGLLIHRIRRAGSIADSAETPADTSTDDAAPHGETGGIPAPEVPPSLDSRLLLSGQLPGGKPFEMSCPVSAEAINLVVGRGRADLRIESAAVSRQHARLNGSADRLTLTDLGSNNGTSVNGVPCLEDEVFYLSPDDIVIFGDARVRIRVLPADEEGS
jgi:outer membrane biosynthesis protein TonB